MKMNVAEMKKLTFACGHTRMDKIENKDNRNKTKVTEMHRNIQEKRLRWYGHIQRREEEFVRKRVLRMEVEGKEAEGNGYPRMRWMEFIKEDLTERKLKTQDAANRLCWRTVTKNADSS
jgi:hypothetical protein